MKCNFCLTGKYHFCRGNIPIGVKRDGGFARFCIVPMAQVYELPKSVNLKQGRILEACPSCLNFVLVMKIGQIQILRYCLNSALLTSILKFESNSYL